MRFWILALFVGVAVVQAQPIVNPCSPTVQTNCAVTADKSGSVTITNTLLETDISTPAPDPTKTQGYMKAGKWCAQSTTGVETCTGGTGGGATRIAGSATFAFGSGIYDGTCAQGGTTITATGVAAGDAISIGATPSLAVGVNVTGKATASNTVTVEVCNWSGATVTPGSTTYQALTVH